jgi:RNA polymerase sigma-70 factor (ECF subfamily)
VADGAEIESEAAAVTAALAGKQPGFRWLMKTHRASVFRIVRGYVGNDDDAMELTQESFVSAFAALRRFDRARPFRTWLVAIAVNKCRDWARKRKVRSLFAFALPLEEAGHVASSAPNPEESLASANEVARIHRALAALPANLREPLILCAVEGISQDEAAEILRISRKAVETRIYRARQKLSVLLEG